MAVLTWLGAFAQVAGAQGPPANVSVQLSPTSIPADGSSTSTVTATVTDAAGNGVPGQVVMFLASDKGVSFSQNPALDNGNGTYTSTLTSSTTPGTVQILALDGPLPTSPAYLTETSSTTTSLTAVTSEATSPPLTNQEVVLVSTVTASASTVTPSGTVSFENGGVPIPGCGAVPTPGLASPALTVTCGTSFAAAMSPVRLTAVFLPGAGSLATGSTSAVQSLSVDRAPTSTSVALVGSKAEVNSALHFTATVTPSQEGPLTPAGSVEFADHGKPIRACRNRPVRPSSIASCTISYGKPGQHIITATYLGDASFGGSSTLGAATVPVQAIGTINAAMQWMFYYTPTYTQVLSLSLNAAPPRATVLLKCHGGGCPFARRSIATGKARPCGPRGRQQCARSRTIDLTPRFRRQDLAIGTRITVEIVKPGWVGKYYTFTMIARHGPLIHIG